MAKLWYYTKTNGTLIYEFKNFLNKYVDLELGFTMEKSMILYSRLWNFDLLRKKIRYTIVIVIQ